MADGAPLLVRHHLTLPAPEAVEQARRLVAEEGYALAAERDGAGWRARASRVEVPSGLVLSRERSRMAGLAQRLGGDVAGWDVCGPDGAAAAPQP
nr:ribonuclease E inhibitor RraB [Motilibacter aurantiacus]